MFSEQVSTKRLHNGGIGITCDQLALEANGQGQGRVGIGPGSDLPPLQRAQLTAQAVAHSTGQAVEKLSHHYHQQQQEHSSWSQGPLQNSSSESVQLGSSTNSDGEAPLLPAQAEGWRVLQKPTAGHSNSFAHSTPLIAVDSHQLHAVPNLTHRPGQLAGFSPIEKAVYTAEQVAESTGEAVQKLSQSLSEHRTPPHVE